MLSIVLVRGHPTTSLHKRQGIVGACSTQIHSDDKGGSW